MPTNSWSARSSRDASSVRWPSMLCITGRIWPPRTIRSMPGRSTSVHATSRALVMTVRSSRSTRRRANARVVLPLAMTMVEPSRTSSAAAAAMRSLAGAAGSMMSASRGPGMAAPPYVRTTRPPSDSRWRSRLIVDMVTPTSLARSSTDARPRVRSSDTTRSSRSAARTPRSWRVAREVSSDSARYAQDDHAGARSALIRAQSRRRVPA